MCIYMGSGLASLIRTLCSSEVHERRRAKRIGSKEHELSLGSAVLEGWNNESTSKLLLMYDNILKELPVAEEPARVR